MVERRLAAILLVLLLVLGAAAIVTLLCGCAPGSDGGANPLLVSVPVPAPPMWCVTEVPARPALPIAKLSDGSAPADTIRAYAASIVLLKSAVVERDELIAGCAPPAAAGAEAAP